MDKTSLNILTSNDIRKESCKKIGGEKKILNELNATEENTQLIIINKGTGAGGANTNYYGKKFEEKTNNQQRLLEMGYTKNSFTKKPKKAYEK